MIERQIILVMPKRIFDLAANSGDAEDDVRADHSSRDRDPVEGIPELEGEGEDVDPCDLGDGDGVGERERRVDDAFRAGEDLVEGGEVRHDLALVDTFFAEGAVCEDRFDVGR